MTSGNKKLLKGEYTMKALFKKIAPLLLSCLLILTPVYASASNGEGQNVVEIVTSSKVSGATSIQDIDRLMEKRTQAILSKDFTAADEIGAELEKLGAKEVSLNEVLVLTDSTPEEFEKSSDIQLLAASATFSTVYSTYTTGGQTYDVMRIYATPTGSTGTLYQTGVTATTNSNSAAANTMQILKMVVSSTVGVASNTIGIAQTVYGFLKDLISLLSPTSTISNITTSYTWSAAESCVFIYFQSKTSGAWVLAGQYSKATTTMHTATPVLKVQGTSVIGSTVSKDHNGSATPLYYNDTAKAYTEFRATGIHVSRIKQITVTGVEGKTVKTIRLANPDIPAAID
jgi:hypothetical protein